MFVRYYMHTNFFSNLLQIFLSLQGGAHLEKKRLLVKTKILDRTTEITE